MAIQIEHLSNEAAIDTLKYGTKIGKLREKIMTKKPQTFPKAMVIATKLIDLDKDLRDTCTKDPAEHVVKKEDKRDNRREYNLVFRSKMEKRYAHLDATRSEILMWIKQNVIGLPIPRKLNPNSMGRRDKNKWCKYHRDHSHDTDECHDLKMEIDQFVEAGYLKEFTKDNPRR